MQDITVIKVQLTVKEEKPEILIFYNTAGKQVLAMKYDPSRLLVVVEEKLLEDKRITNSWD